MSTSAEVALTALKTALANGRLYLFAGPVPATAEEALDMGSSHTQICEFTESGDGATGLTFAAPAGSSMSKAGAEEWKGLIAFSGADDSETTLTPTFWRFGTSGDNCQAAATDPRLQGTAGGPLTDLPCAPQTDNGTNTLTVDLFAVVVE
jgi:hypothetical protein